MEILRSKKMIQKTVKGFNGKKYNTIADEVIGKYVVMIRLNGLISLGYGETEELAIIDAKSKIN